MYFDTTSETRLENSERPPHSAMILSVAVTSRDDMSWDTTFPLWFLRRKVCHENKSAVCRVVVRNFGRDGGRPTAFGEQALIATHFMLLWWQQKGSERWLKAFLWDWQGMRQGGERKQTIRWGVVSKVSRSHQNQGSFWFLEKNSRRNLYCCLLGVRRIGGTNLS